MTKIAVTGNIGSGKTEFIKFISKLGFCCISSDAIISKLYNDDRTRKIILNKFKNTPSSLTTGLVSQFTEHLSAITLCAIPPKIPPI